MALVGSARAVTRQGILRAWCPSQVEPATAGTVVYVHGYGTTVDQAWEEHRLSAQFAASRQNAVFAAVSAPASKFDGVSWPSLGEVRAELAALTGLGPSGPVVVVAHSGGYRTVAKWLARDEPISQICLLDALYGHVTAFQSWLEQPAMPPRSMNLVVCGAGAPRANAERLLAGLGRSVRRRLVRREGVPLRYEELSVRERGASVLHVLARQSHMGLVTEGVCIPVLLRRSPLQLLANHNQPSTQGVS